MSADHEDLFAAHRKTLLGVAYRITGQVADAEDVVQEAWLRWSRVEPADVRDARAFLVRVTTRLSLDRLRRRKARREEYFGEWLPQPIAAAIDPSDTPILAESISMAMLVVLETLSPLERAVFVLREVFGFSHGEIAEGLDRSEAAIRQLAKRARDRVRERRPRFSVDRQEQEAATERFLAAAATGDVGALMSILAPGVELLADGGGRVRAPLLPVRGVDKVARFLAAVAARPEPHQSARIERLNGGPAIVIRSGERAVAVVIVDVVDGLVERIYLLGNPEKLDRLIAR